MRRSDHGSTRAVPAAGMDRYAEIVAALKIRTSNKKGRHLSTARAIQLLETDGVETPDGPGAATGRPADGSWSP